MLQALPWPCCRIGAPSKKIPPKTHQPELTPTPSIYVYLLVSVYIYIVKGIFYVAINNQNHAAFWKLFDVFATAPISFPYATKCQSSISSVRNSQPFWTNPSTSSAKSEWNSRGQNRQMSETNNSGKHSNAHQKIGQVRTRILWKLLKTPCSGVRSTPSLGPHKIFVFSSSLCTSIHTINHHLFVQFISTFI